MASSLPTPTTTGAQVLGRELTPTFFRALRGVWTFTWKANVSLGRIWPTVLALLVLPVLVYLTTPSVSKWNRQHSVLGSPMRQVQEVAERLEQAGVPLTVEQRRTFQRIFNEEFARTEQELREASSGRSSVRRLRDQIRDTYDRIYDRTRSVLAENQYAAYREYESQAVRMSQDRVREARWSRTEPFYRWLFDFYFFVIVPLNCVRACGGLIRDEVQANTLGFLVTRPITRARLLLAKFIAQDTWLQLLLLVETLLLFVVGMIRQVPDLLTLLPLFLAAQFLAVVVWGALGSVLGQLTKRYMAAGLLYGLVVELGIGQIPTNINNLSLTRQFKSLLSHNETLRSIFEWTSNGLPTSLGVICAAAVIFLVGAALLFTFREYHHTVEMQK